MNADCLAAALRHRPSDPLELPSAASLLRTGSSSANLCGITAMIKTREKTLEEHSSSTPSASSSTFSSPEKAPPRVPSGPDLGESRLCKRWLTALAAREMAGSDEMATSSLLDLACLCDSSLPEEPSPTSVQHMSFENDLEAALLEPPRPIR